ncbi:MAG: phage tail assembly chaperone [Robiginitomaculum sp.]
MDEWPFDLWLRYGVKALRLSPSEFWAMSVRDWFVLIMDAQTLGIERSELIKLMKNYPDEVEHE